MSNEGLIVDNAAARSTRWSWLIGASLLAACGTAPAADSESTETGSGSEFETASDADLDTETGGDEVECDPAAFEHAPPATMTVDGLPAVPIDILGTEAQMTFDFDGKYAVVDTTMTFQVGEQGGMPLFDLRQGILVAELDGATFDPALLERHDFGVGESFGFRVIEQEMEPCSIHTLRLGYELLHPQDGPMDGIRWIVAPPGLVFDSKFQESAFGTKPSLYLDSWLPANLPFDRHTLSISMLVEAAPAAHMVISNGEVEELAEHQWQIEFGPETTSMSPYFGIRPVSPISTASGVLAAANGQEIPYVLYHDGVMSTGCLLEECESQLLSWVNYFVGTNGPYQHPSLTAYLANDVSAGAYDGLATAVTLNNLLVRLSFSWWGAGIHPARHTDAWFNHGWNYYSTDGINNQDLFDWETEPPVALVDPHPFARSRHPDALNEGYRVFTGLAAIVGPQTVLDTMAAIYAQTAPLGSLTTEELERQFYCLNDANPEIRRAFWRYVYGFEGEPESPPADYCD